MTGLTLHIKTPGIVGPVVQIIQIALVAVGLTLKRDIVIGITTHGEPDDPFHKIGQKKEHKQHLALLRRVDALVVNHLVAQIHAMMHKKHAHQVDGRESMERQYGCPHNFHRCKVTTLFLKSTIPYPLMSQ